MLSLSAHAQNTAEQFRVVDIQVEGNRVATRSLILGVASLEVGAVLSVTDVSESIRRLYALGIFRDVRIEAEEVTGGIRIFIIVEELPKLAGLAFEGNKKLKDDKLRKEIGLGVGGYISPYLIEKSRAKIFDLFAAEGYFRAKIEPELIYGADSVEAVLQFNIRERDKVKVEQVVVTGSRRVEAGDLVGRMRNRKRGLLRTSDFAQDKYDEDLQKVIDEYHKRGFIDAYLINDSLAIDTARNRMTIYLDVYEGPRYYFGETSFKGNERLSADHLAKLLKHKAGQVFDSEKYDASLGEVASGYYDIGHLHVEIFDERSTRSDSLIDITYDITEGLPSNINLVKIVGNYKTKDRVIRRELSTLPGQVFDRTALIRSIRDVMALNFFDKVEPRPVNLPSGDVDLVYEVAEKQTGQVSAGAGYNSQDKVVGTFGMGIPNFRGLGQNLSFNVSLGKSYNSFSVSFTEPWMFGYPTSFGASAFSLNRRWYGDYTEGRAGGSLRLGRRLRWPDNYFRVYASYALERTRYYDFDATFAASNSYQSRYYYNNPETISPADSLMAARTYGPYPGSILEYEDWQTASRVSLTLLRDSRNLPEFATKGSILSYTLELTGGLLGGYWEYTKHDFEAAKFIPLMWGWALAAKAQYGVVTAPAGDARIMISDRFTPGGTAYDGIVRGYDDGSLTPDSAITTDTIFYYSNENAVIGVDPPDGRYFPLDTTRVRGKYMFVANVEVQIPIAARQLYGLLFFDAGNSWLYRRDIDLLNDLYKSVGFGFRIIVPGIGTLGFDFGYPLDDVEGEPRSWKPHFQIGTTFR
ncbi:MAG TPA: outer membrane protein assembly factor BamA [candidate division Zixibacteria bacterium]|nr:outer membrane protein assembly factor BamA [candidate division Zixibacteria bacterium]MDD4916995.1 outer membrane protein assembly factor BamA [candidate division Zixibacteria bacterium]MDM7972614.1 outer membrane protein assembly factor BamA [candidate division Zixibacteria bacterium]HOD66172.1 outer membrane protein assembly factor BamA [candidate division Zixibacteria bacterium]HPI31844.1 outer membrane protein assembly factor BamA [candidate division Zixibacteria bacterium]